MAEVNTKFGIPPPSSGMPTITPSELEKLLSQYFEAVKSTRSPVIPIFIFGPPGIGKSAIINAAARKAGFATKTFIASTMDPTLVRGIPYPDKGVVRWFPNSDWTTTVPTVFFFDELNLAPSSVVASLYRIILEGKIEDVDISHQPRIGAGNRESDTSIVEQMPLPLYTRFEVYHLIPTVEDWVRYAKSVKINPTIISFIELNRNMLYWVNPEDPGQAAATPRSWERLSQVLAIGLNTKQDIEGSVGHEPGVEFMRYLADLKSKNPMPSRDLEPPDILGVEELK